MPRSVVSGGAESSYNLSRRVNSWSDSDVSELTEPNFTNPPGHPPAARPKPSAAAYEKPMEITQSKVYPNVGVVSSSHRQQSPSGSGGSGSLFPSRHLPLDPNALSEALGRLPTRDNIAQEQGFLVQVGDKGKSGYEIKTSMAVDENNTSSSTVKRTLTDFELLQEQLQIENPGALIPTLGNRFGRSNDDAQALEVWLFDILTGCRRDGYYVTESVDIGKSHAIEAFLFDSRNSFSSTVNEINRDLRRKSSSKVERVATSSGYSDIMKTLGSVGCFSPSLDAPVAQSVQRSGLAVALFGCSSHQAPLRGPSPELQEAISWDRHSENQSYLAAFYKQKQVMNDVLGVLDARIPMEEARGANWKLLAVTLTALANLERQWENLTFPSVDSSAVAHEKQVKQNDVIFATSENVLYLLARQKVEKFGSLTLLRDLLQGFHDDLLMIGPASVSYENARKSAAKKEPSKSNGWTALSPRQSKINEISSSQSEILYARTGATLNAGLRELASHNSLSYGRVSYIYYKGLAKASSRLTITATEVTKKLKQIKQRLRPTPQHYPYAGDDAKEIKVLKDLLAFCSGVRGGGTNMSQILEASYAKRFCNRNVAFLLELTTGGDITERKEWETEDGFGASFDGEGVNKRGTKELRENEKFVKSLRETALQCVEAISALTKEINIDGVSFDVGKTRMHFERTLAGMLATEEEQCRSPAATSWTANGVQTSLFSTVSSVLTMRLNNEKDLLRSILTSLTSFLAFLESLNSFVNLEKLAFRIESDCSDLRNEALTKLEEKAGVIIKIQHEMKKRNKERVAELKGRLKGLEEYTPTLLKATKDRHKNSKLLKEKLLKISKKRLKILRTHSHIKIVDVVEGWAEKDLEGGEEEGLEGILEGIRLRFGGGM